MPLKLPFVKIKSIMELKGITKLADADSLKDLELACLANTA